MTQDEFHKARLEATNEWTPAHGTTKRQNRRKARNRLKKWTKRLIDEFYKWYKF